MGVGVYDSNFHGTGGTFIVRGPLAEQEHYDAYAAEQGDHALSFEDWAKDEYDEFNRDLVEAVEDAGRELGFGVFTRDNFRADRAAFDSDFVGVLDGGMVEVGWRSWQHDFVVGVGGARNWGDWMADPMAYAEQIIEETGRPPTQVKATYEAYAGMVQEFVRLKVMQAGMECSYKTSGYTSSNYQMPDDVEEKLEMLKRGVVAVRESFNRPIEDVLKGLSPTDRVALTKDLALLASEQGDRDDYLPVKVQIPVVHHGSVLLYSPWAEDARAAMIVPDEVRDAVGKAEELTAVPRNLETAAWFRELQAKRRGQVIVVTADEWVEATGEDCVLDGVVVAAAPTSEAEDTPEPRTLG